ncbi:MAG: prepilin-type N-terminal cleavage/methylation domain-containing protein [Deltaproteobacteria bacterium]|nr:prepilin-type N-terminal cleavage/methylation domain-containing protein [Deltaproteobacteria bacterium]
MDSGAKRVGGFTLLEMVVSLSIIAAIAAFLAVAFRLAGHSISRGGEEAAAMARLRAGTEVLERAVRSADPLAVLPSEGISVSYFRGERGKIRFLSAAAPSSISGGGFRLLCFFGRDSSRNASGLMLSEGSPLRAEGVEPWEGNERPRVLLSEASEIAFGYSPGPTEEGKWEWVETWDSKEKKVLPAAVRVEFVTPSESGPRKTALVIPLPAGGA